MDLSKGAPSKPEMKLLFLRHFDHPPSIDGTGCNPDPHRIGSRMADRYVLRLIALVHAAKSCLELDGLDRQAFLRALDAVIEAKKAINVVVLKNVNLTVPPKPTPAETIEEVPPESIPSATCKVLRQFASDYEDGATIAASKSSAARSCAAKLRDALLEIARDLAIDTHTYPMYDKEKALAIIPVLFGCWRTMLDLLRAAVQQNAMK